MKIKWNRAQSKERRWRCRSGRGRRARLWWHALAHSLYPSLSSSASVLDASRYAPHTSLTFRLILLWGQQVQGGQQHFWAYIKELKGLFSASFFLVVLPLHVCYFLGKGKRHCINRSFRLCLCCSCLALFRLYLHLLRRFVFFFISRELMSVCRLVYAVSSHVWVGLLVLEECL